MDYEKKYNYVRKRAEALKECCLSSRIKDWVDSVFPELSEDEKIRNALIKYLKGRISHGDFSMINNITINDMLAWLEKQEGNNNQNWKPSKEQISALEHFVRSIGESGYASPYDNNTKLLYSLIDDLYELEKQGEQNPIDKVEPRFHEGDWLVTCANGVVQIKAISSNKYVLKNTMKFNIAYVDKYWHSWTIADAKDGDILVHNGITFIFKGIKDGIVKGLCSELSDSILNFGVPEYDKDYSPATEEQQDLLFQKMEEAGWEWDAEKKKLHRKLKDFPKWTEEDSKTIDNCCLLIAAADDSYEKSFKDDCIHYLQNLKQRMTNDKRR